MLSKGEIIQVAGTAVVSQLMLSNSAKIPGMNKIKNIYLKHIVTDTISYLAVRYAYIEFIAPKLT
jgi:hypothetical protein